MSKKIVKIFCCLALIAGLSACSSSKQETTAAPETSTSITYSNEYEELANLFYNQDYKACADMATDLINQSGENVTLLTYRGVAYAKLNKPYLAFQDLIVASKIDYNVTTLLNVGNVLRMFGFCARATDAYQQALSLEPTNTQALMNLTSAYLCYGLNDMAEETFVKMLPNFPNDAVAFTNAAILKYIANDFEQSKSGAQKALEFDAFYKPAYHLMMISCRGLNDTQCATEAETQFNSLKGQTFKQKRFAR